jgi:uncharacterized RDD family membrane protein YckC
VIDSCVVVLILGFAFGFGIAAPTVEIVGVLLALAYLLLADGLPGGQSMGKRILGIAVVDRRTHEPGTYGQSLGRNLLLAVLGIFDWVFIFGHTRQRLGDRAANTIVVRLKHHEKTA